jgi:hypothetical protein
MVMLLCAGVAARREGIDGIHLLQLAQTCMNIGDFALTA